MTNINAEGQTVTVEQTTAALPSAPARPDIGRHVAGNSLPRRTKSKTREAGTRAPVTAFELPPPAQTAEAVARTPSGQLSVASAVILLHQLQKDRRFLIRQKNRLWNGLGGKLRSALGWTPQMSEAETKRIALKAKRIMKAFEKDARDDLADDEVGIARQLDLLIRTTLAMRKPFEAALAETEKRMVQLSKSLPVYLWVEGVHGFGALGLAIIVGEAKYDLGSYRSHSALWKRLGLAVIDGERQQRRTSDAGLVQGYDATRRAEIWTLGDSLFRLQSVVQGPYRRAYDLKRADYNGRVEREEADVAGRKWTKARAHNAAKRYMEKKLIRDLRRAWIATGQVVEAPRV